MKKSPLQPGDIGLAVEVVIGLLVGIILSVWVVNPLVDHYYRQCAPTVQSPN